MKQHSVFLLALTALLPLYAQEPEQVSVPTKSVEAAPVPTPEPTPAPTPSQDDELLRAIAENNLEDARKALDQGANPNATIPFPVSDYWKQRYAASKFECYILHEPGTSALMLACADKKPDLIKLLLDYGADRLQKTRRYKVFALQIAARNQDIETMRRLMDITPESEAGRSRIRVDLQNQTATLWRDDKLLLLTFISSGKDSTPTPKGEYLVTDKERHWKSTIFRVPMPYYLRLSCKDFGLHEGHVPNYRASHGCIRLPEKEAKEFFKQTPVGTLVIIE